MKKKLILLVSLITIVLVNAQAQNTFWLGTNYKGAFPVTDGTPATDWTDEWTNFDPENANYPQTTTTISTDITSNTTLSGVVLLQNKVYVKNSSTLTILPGTIIRGDYTTQGTLIITKGSKIIAEGTKTWPIVFTSNEDIGNRAEGDWGGLVILGQALNNQPGGIANIEGIVVSSDTEYGGTNDTDNSGSLKYVRVEFAGIPLEPNKEINGVTFGSVGSGTQVDYVQVSFSGDDSFEWFGGTVNCKHLIAYRGIDDDFDTDFGYRGNVQFALSIRDNNMYDAPGASNAFESDNDATGSSNMPQTAAVFSNVTMVGPRGNGLYILPVGEKFEKAFQIRRNSSISVFNSLIVGWEKGLSVEGTPVETNITNGTAVFSHNVLLEIPQTCVTATSGFYSTFFGQNSNDSTSTILQTNWVNIFTQLGVKPDARLNSGSVVAVGADFTHPKFGGVTQFESLYENQNTDVNVRFFPNPTSNFLNVIGSGNFSIMIYDNLGNVVINKNVSNNTELDMSNFAKGVYTVLVNNRVSNKIILQ